MNQSVEKENHSTHLLSVIVPYRNEDENLQPFFKELCAALGDPRFECLFVNHGSTDTIVRH